MTEYRNDWVVDFTRMQSTWSTLIRVYASLLYTLLLKFRQDASSHKGCLVGASLIVNPVSKCFVVNNYCSDLKETVLDCSPRDSNNIRTVSFDRGSTYVYVHVGGKNSLNSIYLAANCKLNRNLSVRLGIKCRTYSHLWCMCREISGPLALTC